MSMGADQTDDKISWDDIPAERQHDLLKLAETLGEEDPENAAKAQASRRDLLKGAGALGLGAVLGGASYESFSQPAAASHGGGSVGTSSNPVDVFANSVATDQATLTDTATDPSTAGELRRNGTDAKVYSGGSVRNLSNIGSGGGEPYATVTVAASDALNTAGADYVCDGTNDETTINNAISALPTGGGTVALTEGTFVLGGKISVSSTTRLVGQGAGTILQIAGNTTVTAAVEGLSVDDVEIRNLAVDANASNGAAGHGIKLDSAKQCVVGSCYVFDAANDTGVYFGKDTTRETRYGSWIVDNDIQNCNVGVRCETKSSQYSRICRNQVQGCSYGIYSSSENLIMNDNLVTDCDPIGIRFVDSPETTSGGKSQVTGNTVNHTGNDTNNTGAAFDVQSGCEAVAIIGNTVNSSWLAGIRIVNATNCIVGQNLTGNCNDYHVTLDGSSCTDNVITGNYLGVFGGSKIALQEVNSASGNVIHENVTNHSTPWSIASTETADNVPTV